MSDCALILCGCDKFPALNSTLQSCCKDATSWYHWYAANYPELKGAPFWALYNERFTKQRFFQSLDILMRQGVKKLAIAFSSHGTTIPVHNENHAAIVCSDSNWNDLGSFIYDEDLKERFDFWKSQARFYMTADACESGPLGLKLLETMCEQNQNKFIAPPADLALMIAHNAGGIHRSIGEGPTPNLAYVSGTGGKGFYSIDEGDGGSFSKAWEARVKPTWTGLQIAVELDKAMDVQQQPQAHGGLAGEPWFS